MSAGRQSRILIKLRVVPEGQNTKGIKFFFPKVWFKRSECRETLQEAYGKRTSTKKKKNTKLGTSVGVVPLMCLLWLLLWVVGLAEGEVGAGCRFTPPCHHIRARRGAQAVLSTHPRTRVRKRLHGCQRRLDGRTFWISGSGSGPDSWEERQILTKWKSNTWVLEAELTAVTCFCRKSCKEVLQRSFFSFLAVS